MGRQVPNYTLVVLSQLLEDRTIKLKEHLSQLILQKETLNVFNPISLDSLYEDLHWLILISGHVLCLEAEGETALVPSEIMRYSMDQFKHDQVDLNVSLQLLASPRSNFSDISGADKSADHMIRLISAVFRLAEVLKMAIEANATQHLSPELCNSIIWFMHRWSISYLLPIETYYAEISTTLLQAFGDDTEGAQWTINFILGHAQTVLNAFKGEPKLVKGTIDLLVGLVDSAR